jgi:hypothetical protein
MDRQNHTPHARRVKNGPTNRQAPVNSLAGASVMDRSPIRWACAMQCWTAEGGVSRACARWGSSICSPATIYATPGAQFISTS